MHHANASKGEANEANSSQGEEAHKIAVEKKGKRKAASNVSLAHFPPFGGGENDWISLLESLFRPGIAFDFCPLPRGR